MVHAKPCPTPMATEPSLSKDDGDPFDNPHLYRTIVDSLQYATLTRPDMSFVVNRVSQYMQHSTVPHWIAVKRILHYLCGTLNHGLSFHFVSSFTFDGYSDANWTGCPNDCRSTTGFCIFLGGNFISWSAKKQSTVSRSSTEAEYCSSAEILSLQYLLKELQVSLVSSPMLWCDNISVIFLASNPIFHTRTKYIEIDYHFVRERVANKELRVQFLCSDDQLADALTKLLATRRSIYLKHKLSVLPYYFGFFYFFEWGRY